MKRTGRAKPTTLWLDITKLAPALNRLGRMRFLFYWHNDDFENRYGKQDLPNLEGVGSTALE